MRDCEGILLRMIAEPRVAVRDRPRDSPENGGVWQTPRSRMWSLSEVRWAVIATGMFAVGGLAQLAGAPPWMFWTLYLGCYVAGGWEPGWAGLRALRDRTLDVDLLMVAAAIGAR